jgi:hypothetical protein
MYSIIQEDKTLYGNEILDYITRNKFKCSKWIFMDKIKLTKQNFQIYTIIKITQKYIYCYVYPNIYDNNDNRIKENIKKQALNIIKKSLLTEYNNLIRGNYTKHAFEILCFSFQITNKNKVKLNNIVTDIKNLVKQTYIDDFVTNILNLLIFNL